MMAWRGIFPAVTTQMHAGGHIDDRGTAATVSRPVSEGVAGLVMLGHGRREQRGTAHVRRPRLTLAGEERAVLERMIRVTREELVRYRLSTEPHIKSNTAS